MANRVESGQYYAEVIEDSVNPQGSRLTSIECRFPRFILAEVNTHRMFSRNSASSRAIPVKKQIEAVLDHPFVPERFPINISGMQAHEFYPVGSKAHGLCVNIWLQARDNAVDAVQKLVGDKSVDDWNFNVHKQIANRLLEPFMWHTALISSTSWNHFFRLRISKAAQPEFDKLAKLIQSARAANFPHRLQAGEWHLPYVSKIERQEETESFCLMISTARCARTSYAAAHVLRDSADDIELFQRLSNGGHWSPMEHPALALDSLDYVGNFRGFKQFRKSHNNEYLEEELYLGPTI